MLFTWKPLWLGVNWCQWREGLGNLLRSFKCQSCIFMSCRHLWPAVFLQIPCKAALEWHWRCFPKGFVIYLHINKYIKEIVGSREETEGGGGLHPLSWECQLKHTLPWDFSCLLRIWVSLIDSGASRFPLSVREALEASFREKKTLVIFAIFIGCPTMHWTVWKQDPVLSLLFSQLCFKKHIKTNQSYLKGGETLHLDWCFT